jgi:hypothetical protein
MDHIRHLHSPAPPSRDAGFFAPAVTGPFACSPAIFTHLTTYTASTLERSPKQGIGLGHGSKEGMFLWPSL